MWPSLSTWKINRGQIVLTSCVLLSPEQVRNFRGFANKGPIYPFSPQEVGGSLSNYLRKAVSTLKKQQYFDQRVKRFLA